VNDSINTNHGKTEQLKAPFEFPANNQWNYIGIVVFFALFSLYWVTMPKSIALEDDGLFIQSSYFLGVAHPPGYPFYTLLSWAWAQIPLGEIAYRLHLFSGMFGALSGVLLTLIAFRIIRNPWIAVLSGLMLGVSKIVWSQSIIAEVYSMNMAIIGMLIYLGLLEQKTKNSSPRILYLAAFFYGLGLSNHWPLLVAATPLFAILYLSSIKKLWQHIIGCFSFLLVGLSPYLFMVIRSNQGPSYSTFGPVGSLDDFLFTVTRRGYQQVDQSVTAGLEDKVQYLGFLLEQMANQWGIGVLLIALVGALFAWKSIGKKNHIAFLTGLICTSFVLISLLGFDFTRLKQLIVSVYFLPTYFLLAIFFGVGVELIWRQVHRFSGVVIYAYSFSLIGLLVVALFNGLTTNDRSKYNWGNFYGAAVFSSLPEKATLIVEDDVNTGVLGYLHKVKGIRTDITLINSFGLGYPIPGIDPRNIDQKERYSHFQNLTLSRPKDVYYTIDSTLEIPKRCSVFVCQGTSETSDKTIGYYREQDLPLVKYVIRHNDSDPWTQVHRSIVLRQALRVLTPFFYSDHEGVDKPAIKELLEYAGRTPLAQTDLAEQLINLEQWNDFGGVDGLLDADENNLALAEKTEKANFYIQRARYASHIGDDASYSEYLNKSIESWPSKENPAYELLRLCAFCL
jgi:hypothetical protein